MDAGMDVATGAGMHVWKAAPMHVASRAATTHATSLPCPVMTTLHLAATNAARAVASVAQNVNARHVNRVAAIDVMAMYAHWRSQTCRLTAAATPQRLPR